MVSNSEINELTNECLKNNYINDLTNKMKGLQLIKTLTLWKTSKMNDHDRLFLAKRNQHYRNALYNLNYDEKTNTIDGYANVDGVFQKTRISVFKHANDEVEHNIITFRLLYLDNDFYYIDENLKNILNIL